MTDPTPRLRPFPQVAYLQPGAPPPEPPRRRGLSMKTALLISLPVLLVGVLCGGALLVYATRSKVDAAVPAYHYTPNPAIASAQASINERDAARARVKTAMETALQAQGAALLAGNRAGFVGLADPSAERAVAWMTERFASLHAMGIAQWDATVDSFTPQNEPRWQAFVTVKYCFVANCTRPLTANMDTMWNMSDQATPKLTEMWESTAGRASPPWELSPLRAKVGSRVIVAATKANAGRLSGALATAEAAAKVADSYAGAEKPGRYVIYLAGSKEWGKWPYDEEGKWVAGYATAASESVVVNVASLRTTPLGELLRHEMGHVATLAGKTGKVNRADSWWLVEGMAEYVADGKSFAAYSGRPETISFVRGRWNGDLRVGEPAPNATVRDASARYGTAYLGVSCLMQTYGRTKGLAFFHAVAVEGASLTDAASQSLGVSYASVKNTCVAQIRRTAK